MSIAAKRFAIVTIGMLQMVLIGTLIFLIANKSKKFIRDPQFAIRLRSESYHRVLTSERFPHYYEPEPGTVINDHPSWLGKTVSYSINGDSFNDRMDYPVQRVPGTYRIITMGDSFTYGLFVNTTENYSELLEDKLNNSVCKVTGESFEVINLGVPAYDIGFAAERYRLRGQKYHPDVVIWFLNSFTMGIDAERKTALEEKYLKEIPKDKQWQFINGKEHFYPGMLAWLAQSGESSVEEREMRQTRFLSEFLQEYQGPLIVIANDWDMWTATSKQALTATLLFKDNAILVPVSKLLERGSSLLPDEHPNTNGHTIIAELLIDQLRKHRFFPCDNTHLDE